MAKPGIEWTGRSDWNPIRGCTRVSEGCRNCYAETIAGRFSAPGQPFHGFATQTENGGRWTGKVELIKDRLFLPLSWRKPATIFVNSAFDLFHEDIPDEWIDQVFAVMALIPQHTLQVLTKRAKRMREYLTKEGRAEAIGRAGWTIIEARGRVSGDQSAILAGLVHGGGPHAMDTNRRLPDHAHAWPLPNVWLGVSVEDQARANERIPDLLATPAAVRWISAEPLLGPLSLDDIAIPRPELCASVIWSALRGWGGAPSKINWVVVGGECGPNSRPMHPDWARSIRDQCAEANVPFFFKQWGEYGPCELAPAGTAALSVVTSRGTHLVGKRVLDEPSDQAAEIIARLGKARAGRLLDGIEHNGFPEVRHG
jgi:protein gp37